LAYGGGGVGLVERCNVKLRARKKGQRRIAGTPLTLAEVRRVRRKSIVIRHIKFQDFFKYSLARTKDPISANAPCNYGHPPHSSKPTTKATSSPLCILAPSARQTAPSTPLQNHLAYGQSM